jgi:hypothetical protein
MSRIQLKAFAVLVSLTVLPGLSAAEEAALENTPEGKAGGENASVYLVLVNVVSGDFRFPLIGLANIAQGGHSAPQIGLVNWNTGAFTSLQAGLINAAGGDARGLQMGLANTAFGKIRGAQVGLINVTQELKGLQFGFFNYAGSADGGISIGMLSIVQQGAYRALELSFAETMPLNLAFKIGTEKFYSSLSISYDSGIAEPRAAFGFGFGFGSIVPVAKDFFVNPELNNTVTLEFKQNFLSLTPLAGFKLGSRFSIVAGPSLTYMYVREDSGNSGPFFTIGREFAGGHSLLLGAKAGIRFRF